MEEDPDTEWICSMNFDRIGASCDDVDDEVALGTAAAGTAGVGV